MLYLASYKRNVFCNVVVIDREIAIIAVHVESLIVAAFLEQPDGRFSQKRDADSQESGRNQLHTHGNAPSHTRFRRDIVDNAIVYSVKLAVVLTVATFQGPTDPEPNHGTYLIG